MQSSSLELLRCSLFSQLVAKLQRIIGMENKIPNIQSIASKTFPQILTLKIENFSSENAIFPQNDGKLFRRGQQKNGKVANFSSEAIKTMEKK